LETQNVTADATGHYTVQLGSTKPEGVPMELFTSGEARWLGVQASGQKEQPRVLLLSVPYALKAADAETLGGKPASAFSLINAPSVTSGSSASSAAKPAAAPGQTITNGGKTNFIAGWTSSTTLGTSAIFQSPTTNNIGIATTTPAAKLDVNGNGIFRGPLSASTSAAGGSAVHGTAKGTNGVNYGVIGDSSNTGGGSSGIFGRDLNSNAAQYTVGVTGSTGNLSGIGVLGFALATTPDEFNTRVGQHHVGVWGDSAEFGVVATSDLNAIVAYNNHPSGATIFAQNDTTATNGLLFFAAAPKTGGSCNITTHGDLGCTGSGSIGGNLGISGNGSILGSLGISGNGSIGGTFGIGTSFPQASLNVNHGGTATQDTLLVGNNSTKGLQLRDTGTAVDLESIGVPLFVNNTTKQNLLLNPAGGPVGIGTTSPNSLFTLTVGNGANPNVSADFLAEVDVETNLVVAGDFFAGGTKNFHIDHPLDPANKYLDHASIESSEVLNMYTGNIVLDGKGEARVQMPAWFGALNADFRYQLTAIGAPGPNLYIADEVRNNGFRIAGGSPGMKVSWQITCLRQDAHMKVHPFVVEREKPAAERGYYIHPELFGAPKEKGISWTRRSGKTSDSKVTPKQTSGLQPVQRLAPITGGQPRAAIPVKPSVPTRP
jgi:hypothetical protein